MLRFDLSRDLREGSQFVHPYMKLKLQAAIKGGQILKVFNWVLFVHGTSLHGICT